MRALAQLATVAILLRSSYSTPDAAPGPVPFIDAFSNGASSPLLLEKRQGCQSGYSSCSNFGDDSACCPDGTLCARDQTGQIACCPIGAVCVGTLGSDGSDSSAASTTTPPVLGGGTTSPPTTAQATLASGYSTVPNDYYPFIQIPSVYPNSQACLAAFTSCQSASTACFNSLNGQNGVTVSALGTQGLTQQGISGTLASGASSICGSLSARGCYELQSTQCSQFGSGTGGATATTGFVAVNTNNARPGVARCTGALYTAAAAAMAGAGVARIMM